MCANNKLIRLLNARKIQLNWTARITLLGPEVLLEWIQKKKKKSYIQQWFVLFSSFAIFRLFPSTLKIGSLQFLQLAIKFT
jgi:hypothetical protein